MTTATQSLSASSGSENLTIETCRKLARAPEIDLNTLDQALARQEAIARAKQQ